MATKTINLTGAEVEVTGLDGAHAHIRNDSTEVIYAAKTAGITAGADGVASIPAGQSDTIRGISGAVYLLGTGSVLIQSDDYVASPFKTSAASGGSGADEVARTAINTHAGNDEIHVTAAEKARWDEKSADKADSLVDFNSSGTLIKIGYNGSALSTADYIAAYDTSEIDSGGVVKIKDLPISSLAELLVAAKHSCFVINYNNMSGSQNVVNDFKYPNNYEGNYYSDSDDQSGLPESWWYIKYFHHMYESGYGLQIAFPMDSLSELPRYRTSDKNGWKNWRMISDGGNAAALESHPTSDFVLKSDYDALAARVAALENGGTT